jgi:hypothetical protein
MVLIPIAMVVAAELIVRLPALGDLLPRQQLYYDVGVETRLQKLESLSFRDTVDILFVGSSIVRTNFQPVVFDSVFARNRSQRVVSFNGGFSGMHPDPTRLYLEHFWLRRTSPRFVMQGVAFGELTSQRKAEEWEEFTASRLERQWIEDDWLSRVNATLLSSVRLLNYQGAVTGWFADGWTGSVETDFPIDDRGFGPTQMTLTQAMAAGEIQGPGTYGNPYAPADFAIGLTALENAIEISRQHGVHFVIVNMPEYCGRYLTAADGLARYRAYLNSLRQLASREGVSLIDVTRGDPSGWCDKEQFSDHHHMSPAGAHRFSVELAEALAKLPDAPVLTQRNPALIP